MVNTGTRAQTPSLGQFDQQIDIDPAGQSGSRPGAATYDEAQQSYTLVSPAGPAGPGVQGEEAPVHFLHRRLAGDFIVTAQVVAREGGQSSGLGLLVRAGLEPYAPYVAAAVDGAGVPWLRVRRTQGGAIEHVQAPLAGADVVQLERKGHSYVLSAARFGDPFTTVAATDVDLGDELYAGLFAGALPGAAAVATFRNVRLVKPAAKGFDRARDPFVSRLELLDVADGRREVIYAADDVLEAPNWTRDGAALIYNSGGRLYRFDLQTRTPAPIDTGDVVRNNNDHVLSFDGEQLAISSHDERDDSQVYIVPLAGGQPRRVTPVGPSYLHGWSPDGKQLVYTGYRNGVFDIYRIGAEDDAAGGAEEQLTRGSGLDDGPEYTPDGQSIYFNSTRSGRMQIWRMKADGSGQEQMTDDECDNWFPHISPDGRQVVFLSYLAGEVEPHDHPPARRVYLRLMPVNGGAPKVIAYLYGGQGTINVPSWSPDGRWIAFVSNTMPIPSS